VATFIKITNQDIYKKLCDIEEHIMITNGKVKLNKWISTTALSLALLGLGWCLALIK
jgi:hypothetical protein